MEPGGLSFLSFKALDTGCSLRAAAIRSIQPCPSAMLLSRVHKPKANLTAQHPEGSLGQHCLAFPCFVEWGPMHVFGSPGLVFNKHPTTGGIPDAFGQSIPPSPSTGRFRSLTFTVKLRFAKGFGARSGLSKLNVCHMGASSGLGYCNSPVLKQQGTLSVFQPVTVSFLELI